MKPVCLTIAGSDSSAGAGIQADLATFSECGAQGVSVITALTAQNPDSVLRVEPAPLEQIGAEMEAVFSYYHVAAVKTGMLLDAERINTVAEGLKRWHADKPLIVDPVMVATSGAGLLAENAVQALTDELFPLATAITPNIAEAECLLARKVEDVIDDAALLAQQYGCAVLIKGGHGRENVLIDVLCEQSKEVVVFSHKRIDGAFLHGTGCRLSAAITAGLARGQPLHDAVERSIQWLQEALADSVGKP